MISILIPVHNYDITALVADLHTQATNASIDFEILVLEDGSTRFLEQNQAVSELPFCRYQVLPANIGRAAIRNKLADMAQYEHLLFLDCDSAIASPHFLNRYLACCSEKTIVLGGRIYADNTDKTHSLAKKYGDKRERNDTHTEANRKKHPMFTTPNFLIPRVIFSQIRFDETIVGYGHEDTIFGIELQRSGYHYSYIDNPVIHLDLPTNRTYLRKSEAAIENLYHLHQSGRYPELDTLSKLLSVYLKLHTFKHILSVAYHIIHHPLERHLCGKNPNLRLFDLYKFLYLCKFATHN